MMHKRFFVLNGRACHLECGINLRKESLFVGIQIVADSCCDLTEQMKTDWNVKTVPLTMTLENKSFVDDVSLDLSRFMEEMKACRGRIGSAAPAPALYQEAFESTEDSFAVTISGNLSGSYTSAMLGKSLAEENGAHVHVFDSKSAAAGEALIILKIRKLLRQELPKSEIIMHIEHFIDNMKTFFILDNVDNLLKNGRLNRITGNIISKLHIRPILGSDGHGNISLFSHVQGWKQAVKKLADTIESSGKRTEGESIVISHCGNPGLAGELEKEILRRYRFQEVLILATRGLSSVYANEKGVIIAF